MSDSFEVQLALLQKKMHSYEEQLRQLQYDMLNVTTVIQAIAAEEVEEDGESDLSGNAYAQRRRDSDGTL